MLKNKTFRAQVDQNYRKRALENHLRGVPMFADLSAGFIERSEERRVGKEGRSRGVPDHLKKKDGIRDKLVTGVQTCALPIYQNYRKRALENHLRGVPMFADLSAGFIEHLKGSVELLRFSPGQTIAKQGDAADSFYLVRIGFVKISENYSGGELVLAYLSRGDYFGEIGLLGGGTRTAT